MFGRTVHNNTCDPTHNDNNAHDIPMTCQSVETILAEWDSIYATEVKKCGEVLQQHICRPVYHKYGNDKCCRFLFPHKIIDASFYDSETKLIVLLCRDSTVNYFNPYLLIFCWHNHDLKCILSGKSAKAAMFYIMDYITKMDFNTYQILSLLSKAVAQLPNNSENTPLEGACKLLHKCLSQFTQQQQIHELKCLIMTSVAL